MCHDYTTHPPNSSAFENHFAALTPLFARVAFFSVEVVFVSANSSAAGFATALARLVVPSVAALAAVELRLRVVVVLLLAVAVRPVERLVVLVLRLLAVVVLRFVAVIARLELARFFGAAF